MDIDQDMLDHFDTDWKVATGDVNQRLSPGSRMQVNSIATWIVGPQFRSDAEARRFLESLRAALELIVEAKQI